ncbi:MAG: metallophosphoesterase [Blastocatellia bacterium]|nr:metallophosphoesterase [Blastocatellia bacterium]
MKKKKSNLITRRQAIFSMATITAGALIKPSSIFCSPVKDNIRFAVIGDWGTGDHDQVGIAKQMFLSHQRTPLDFVITAGDNIYPNGSGRYFDKHFEEPFADLLKDRVRFYAVLGNHDVDAGREDQCQYPLFNMGGHNYYKFARNNGLIEFFMLDSTDFDSTQATWLENSLRASRAKWKIAVFHHPIYSSGKKHGSSVGLRKKLEPLFTRYGVNVAFSGHDHIYERTLPQQDIQYFVTGAGGKTRRGDVNMKSSIRAASFDQDNHYMLIEVDELQVSFQAISETGAIVDNGSIRQAESLLEVRGSISNDER